MEQLTLLLEGFPASPTAPQESGEVKKMSAIYGQKCLEQYARFPRVSLWAKTFAASLIGMEAWYSTRCALSWKVLGIKSRPLLYLRAVSVRPTEGSEYGLLLKTPAAMDAYSEKLSKKEQKFGNSGTLAQEVATGFIYQRGLLPTPMAQSRETTEEQTIARQKKYGGKTRAMYLENYLALGLLFSPKACDYKNQRKTDNWKGLDLSSQVKELTGTNSRLNHQFVAEMMGFPPNWTELPFLSGETKVSKPTETP